MNSSTDKGRDKTYCNGKQESKNSPRAVFKGTQKEDEELEKKRKKKSQTEQKPQGSV